MLRRVAPRALLWCALAVLAGALVPLAGCRSRYPACANDDDCNRDPKRTVREFCINKLCQQCRDNGDCKESELCNKGRCDPNPAWCADDAACPAGTSCIEHRCANCTGDAQCGEGGRCLNGKCIRKGGCTKDEDCKESEDCREGRCVPAGPARASQDGPCQLTTVFFDFNESVLSVDATAAIDANAACITKAARPVQLIGRSDPRGTIEYNLALSERRGVSVKDRLVRLGIEAGRLRVLARGELDSRGADEAGWAQDRRVDFEWR